MGQEIRSVEAPVHCVCSLVRYTLTSFRYDDNFRKASEDFSVMRSYLHLSLASLLVFQKNKNYKYLNVALKLNDCICTRTNYILQSELDADLAHHCLTLERKIVDQVVSSF